VVYARKIEGKVLDLGVSGALYRDSLVMYDRETGSYWSQVDGRALRGPLTGKKLSEVPSVVTTWSDWRREHPGTLLLRPEPRPRVSPYERYFPDPEKLGVLGTKNPDARLPGKTWVWGIADSSGPVAVVEERLDAQPREFRIGSRVFSVSKRGDRVSFSPEGLVLPRRVYWYVWASFHPGSRIWPDRK
jgi:hypothetical protein